MGSGGKEIFWTENSSAGVHHETWTWDPSVALMDWGPWTEKSSNGASRGVCGVTDQIMV